MQLCLLQVENKRLCDSHLPEIALVTDMSGECRAGVTPHTVWYPTIPERPNVVTICVKASLGATVPRPNIPAKPRRKAQESTVTFQ